jgi:hypothetical protein
LIDMLLSVEKQQSEAAETAQDELEEPQAENK